MHYTLLYTYMHYSDSIENNDFYCKINGKFISKKFCLAFMNHLTLFY